MGVLNVLTYITIIIMLLLFLMFADMGHQLACDDLQQVCLHLHIFIKFINEV